MKFTVVFETVPEIECNSCTGCVFYSGDLHRVCDNFMGKDYNDKCDHSGLIYKKVKSFKFGRE